MSKPAWRPSSKYKLSRVTSISLALFVVIYGGLLLRNLFSETEAATALCYNRPAVSTMTAPSSVTPGQTFSLTNITGSGNTNIATVNSVTRTYSINGATPTSVSRTWSGGPVQGDYVSTYDDINVTTTGSVGGQVTVNLVSIQADITVGSENTSVTCSVDNGQLTANNPGESLTLATINIIAPATESGGSSTPSSGNQTGSSSSNLNTSQTGSSENTAQAADTSGTGTAADADSGGQILESTGQDVRITVRDHTGQPITGARVVIDSLPGVSTDDKGEFTLRRVSAGKHTLSVSANGQTVTRQIDVEDRPDAVLAVEVRLPAPSSSRQKMFIAAGIFTAVVGLVAAWFIRRYLAVRRSSGVTPPSSAAGRSADQTSSTAPRIVMPQEGEKLPALQQPQSDDHKDSSK